MKLCNLEMSKTLQEMGYDGYYNYIYAKNTESSLRYIGFKEVFELSEYTGPPAPRLDDAAYWIRDKYKLSIEVGVTIPKCWIVYIFDFHDSDIVTMYTEVYNTYDTALEAAVTKALEIIKNKKQ